MAPTRTNSDDTKYAVPSLEEIIFSCGICQATVSDLYPANQDNPESHSDNNDGMGTKLWIGNCVHVFCGRHLEGGGVPFHSSSEPPQAECPVCVRAENNHEIRNLYGIRGVTEGKFDSAIPTSYVQCPPVSLDGTEPGVEALRFQYSRMKCYSQEVTKRWKSAERKRRAIEGTLHKERKHHRKLEVEHQELQKQKDDIEKKLQGWEGRKDQIKHYMGAVSEMAGDIQMMRRELVKMGYNVEKKSYGLDTIAQASQQQPPVSHAGRGDSSATLVGEPHDTSSSKRKRVEENSYPDDKEIEQELAQENSRHMAPPSLPPLRPAQQMRPPALHPRPANTGRTLLQPPAGPMQREPQSSRSAQMYNEGRWQPRDSRAGSQRHQHPLPALQSMRLNSAARPFQRFAAPPSIRAQEAAPRQYEPIRSERSPAQPPRLQPAGLYSQAPTQHRYDGGQQEGDFMVEMTQHDPQPEPSLQEPLYAEDVEMYEYAAQSHSFAPPTATPYSQAPEGRVSYSRNEAPTRHTNHDQPRSSVLSPFFKSQGGRNDQLEIAPPVTRNHQPSQHVRPPIARSAAIPRGGASMAPPRSLMNERGIMRGTFPSDVQYGPPRSRPQPIQPDPMSQRQSSVAPQRISYQPSGSQLYSRPTYSRPAAVMPPPSRADSRMAPPRSTQPYRSGRMTLPPRPSSQRGWDPQVSQIRGVRGAGPAASSQLERQSAAPPYSAR